MILIPHIQHLEKARKFPGGTVLFPAGKNDGMLILLRGTATVQNVDPWGKFTDVAHIEQGGYFGEYSLLLGEASRSQLVADGEVIVLPVERSKLSDFIQKETQVVQQFLEEMARRAFSSAAKALETTPGSLAAEASLLPPEAKTENYLTIEAPAQPAAAPAAVRTADKGEVGFETPLTEPREKLFPPGHGYGDFVIDHDKPAMLMDKGYTCPFCGHAFRTLRVKKSKLSVSREDDDMRIYYKDVEPMHYDVVTCPSCLYSASEDMFADAIKTNKATLLPLLDTYQKDVAIGLGTARDPYTIFAGFYLAIICAPKCFPRPLLLVARLLVQLSRLYADSNENAMERYIQQQALNTYLEAFQKYDIDKNQSQQIAIMIGEMYIKLGDYAEARKFFFRAKTEFNLRADMTKHANKRIDDIRELAPALVEN
ncbi:MAG: DUF2225 domain-containing protein [Oscillospiraceae bacterium]|jgi:uncharacterized protein (DUF2225 family)/CRP-like cAMP-binding protein|nr:DUF2225 domain-containing protein [Oscillospiraceae bacterium]